MTSAPAAPVPPTPPSAHDIAAAADALGRLNGSGELTAAILGLLALRGSKRARRAWQIETEGHADAARVLALVDTLPAGARLPWFERLLVRMRRQPLEQRQALLESTRRLMGARGVVRPLDRLHWLAMRRRLGESPADRSRHAADADLSQLPDVDLASIATCTAFLSKMIPAEPGETASAAEREAGAQWYRAVMAHWPARDTQPLGTPDTSALVQALQQLQTIPWMQRPVLVRTWISAALPLRRHGRWSDEAADALRLVCSLLDCPMPPELARHFDDTLPESA